MVQSFAQDARRRPVRVRSQSVSHSHLPPEYWTRRHSEPVVLDIGGEVGALVLYTPPALHGCEIEVAPLGNEAKRVHSAVLERSVGGRVVYAATYPELPAGNYEVCCAGGPRFTIVGGNVSEAQLTSGC